MTLEQVLAKHLAPRLEATRTVNTKYCGATTATYEVPDWDTQLKMLKLALQASRCAPGAITLAGRQSPSGKPPSRALMWLSKK